MKKQKNKIITIIIVCIVFLIGITTFISSISNQDDSYYNNNDGYTDEYGDYSIDETENIENENQAISLADSCQYILSTGYDNDGTCYQLVGEDYEDYQGSQIRIGVIKNNEWLVEMTNEIPFIDEYNCIYGNQSLNNVYVLEGFGTLRNAVANDDYDFYSRFGYIGKGSFYLLGAPRDSGGYYIEDQLQTIVFWNAESSKSKIINNVTMDDMDNYILGNSIVICKLTDHDFRLSNDAFAKLDVKLLNPETFETKKIFSKKLTVHTGMSNKVHQISDGYFFSNNSNHNTGSFYNTNGSKAFDLDIKNIQEIGHFNEGKCEIITQIETGSKYSVIIDKKGKVTSNELIVE